MTTGTTRWADVSFRSGLGPVLLKPVGAASPVSAAAIRAGLEAPTQWGHNDEPRYLPISDPDARRDAT